MIYLNLNSILGEKRIKMSELSVMSGVNKNTILAMYHNKQRRVDLEVLDKICKALNCDVTDIIKFKQD